MLSCRMIAVSCGLLLYFVSNVSRYPKLQVIQVLLLVVLVRADDLVPAGGCTLPAGSYSFILLDCGTSSAGRYKFIWLNWFLLVVVPIPTGMLSLTDQLLCLTLWSNSSGPLPLYVPKRQGLPTSLPPLMVIEVVVTESLKRTQLQLDDVNGLYEFTLHDVLDGMRAIGYPIDGFILDGMIGNIGSKHHKFLMYPRFLQMILGIQTTDPSLRPTVDFTAKLFSNMKLNWDGPHMPLLAPMLVVPATGDGIDAVAAGAAAAHDVSPPPIVPPTHSTPGPSSAPQVTPMREPTPVRDPKPVRDPTPIKDPTPVWEPTPSPVKESTPDSPRPPFPPPRTEEVGPTTSTRPPSLTRHTFVHEDISEGGGDFVSSPPSHEAPQTPAATAAGEAEDSAALTTLSLKLDRVKRLEGLLQQRKWRLVLSDSKGEDTTPTEQDIDLEALHMLTRTSLGSDSSDTPAGHDAAEVPADTSMPSRNPSTTRRRLKKPFSSFAFAHVSENIPAGASVPAAATTIPAGSSVDAAVIFDLRRIKYI
nr:hypothetical protein [Tanacetum cinerariifolium]